MTRRADRLFEIIQILRSSRQPTTAAALAAQLEVTPRTIYRDVATLQARRIPIEGAAGVGYVLRRGFNLPPLMFTAEELDSMVLGALLIRRIRDPKLQAAADSVLGKVTAVLPDALRTRLGAPALYVSDGDAPAAPGVDLSAVRGAIRDTQKMRIAYLDETGQRTQRTIWPIAVAYYVDITLVAAWCELRQDMRPDRIERSEILAERFPADTGRRLADWLSSPKARPAAQ